MTDATAVLSCPVCREILKGRPVSMESAPKDPCDGLVITFQFITPVHQTGDR